MTARQPTKVAIVGAGNVGATAAYALLLSGLTAEIVLIDANQNRAEGEAMDLAHAVPFSRPTRVWAGDYEDCAGAVVTVLAAGTGQRPGETRLDLVKRNAAIIADIVPKVAVANPDGIILVATNPVDVLTHVAWRISGLPASRVIGSGTTLDTGRFRAMLGDHFGVDPRSVHAFIIGEHGDSEVPVWSSANVAGVGLEDLARARGIAFEPDDRDRIFTQTRDAAYVIIQRKGATYYAVAVALLGIIEAVVRDQRTVLSVSSVVGDKAYGLGEVCLSLPSVVGAGGIVEVLHLRLSGQEELALRASAEVVRAAQDQIVVNQPGPRPDPERRVEGVEAA
jgi:L-lactate dehydrogenase